MKLIGEKGFCGFWRQCERIKYTLSCAIIRSYFGHMTAIKRQCGSQCLLLAPASAGYRGGHCHTKNNSKATNLQLNRAN